MTELFDVFPYLENEIVIIRKMEESDVPALSEISNNDNVYKYIPPFLYKKRISSWKQQSKILEEEILIKRS